MEPDKIINKPIVLENEGLKLTRGMTGNYSWDIKLHINEGDENAIERIAKINAKMMNLFTEGAE